MKPKLHKIAVPSSKSYTNRALLLAALGKGKHTIINPLNCDDTRHMLNTLKNLGVRIEQKNDTQIVVHGLQGRFKKPSKILNIGNAGTAMRFLTPVLTTQPFTTVITGNKRMQERPMKDLIASLTEIGFKIESKNGCPPLTIHGDPTIKPKKIIIASNTSSQYVSALLLASPLLGNPKTLLKGKTISAPYIKMTENLIKKFSTKYTVETDASSASYFFALGALGFDIKVLNLSKKSLQADIKALDYLKKMGCRIREDKEGIQVLGPRKLKPLGKVDLRNLPDSAMTIATLCCFASGKSILKGLSNLRVKETDRLSALAKELSKTGAHVRETEDGLIIIGTPNLHGATIETYNDHRMAMCAGILKSRIPKIRIRNSKCVSKTYPNFWKDFAIAIS